MKWTGASGAIPLECSSAIMSSTTPRDTAEISGIVTPSCDDMTKVVGGTVLSVTAIREREIGGGNRSAVQKDARFHADGRAVRARPSTPDVSARSRARAP